MPEGQGTFIADTGRKYSGDWKNGRPDGSGTMTYQEGSRYDTYEGQWGAGRFHGNGKLVKGNGDKLEGNFRWGALHGFGIYRYANGDVYEGEYDSGKRDGYGKFTSADGDITAGIWRKGANPAEVRAMAKAEADARREEYAEAQLGYLEAQEGYLAAQKKREQQRIADAKEKEQAKARERELAFAAAAEARLQACDSFGFERGTDSHAECAMQLYINEQKQATTSQVTEQQRDEQQAVLDQQQREQEALLARQKRQLARQEAIEEAILREQERARHWERSMKLIELGTGIATGSLGGRSTPRMQSHTYTINGQIINCTTTGSSTDCR